MNRIVDFCVFSVLVCCAICKPFVIEDPIFDLYSDSQYVDYGVFGSDDNTSITLSVPNKPKWMSVEHVVESVGFIDAQKTRGLFIRDEIAYITVSFAGLKIVDISDKTFPVDITTVDMEEAEDVFVYNDYAYIADETDGMRIVSLTDVNNAYDTGATLSTPGIISVFVNNDNYSYVGRGFGGGGIFIVNHTNKSEISILSEFDTQYAYDIFVHANFCYVADSSSGLRIINITDKISPTEISTTSVSGAATNIFVQDDYAYISVMNSGLKVYDVSNSESPAWVSSFEEIESSTFNVFAEGSYIFMGDGETLKIVDVSDIANPSLYRSVSTSAMAPNKVKGVYVQRNYLYVSLFDNGVDIFEFGKLILHNASIDGRATCGNVSVTIRASDRTGFVDFTYTHEFPSDFCTTYGHGTCDLLNNTCICDNLNYTGDDCSQWSCFGVSREEFYACNGGTCNGHNNCSCPSDQSGENCEIWTCWGVANTLFHVDEVTPLACSLHGTCESPDHCNCSSGYAGNNCSDFDCFSTSKFHPDVCFSHGNCTGPNECVCDANQGYYGLSCNNWNCSGHSHFENDACSGNGQCVSPSNCSCFPGFSGNDCNIWTCDGILYSDEDVCGGRGICHSLDNCGCTTPENYQKDHFDYFGKNCEIKFGKSLILATQHLMMIYFEIDFDDLVEDYYGLEINQRFECSKLFSVLSFEESEAGTDSLKLLNCSLTNINQFTYSSGSTQFLKIDLSHMDSKSVRNLLEELHGVDWSLEIKVVNQPTFVKVYPPINELYEDDPIFTIRSFQHSTATDDDDTEDSMRSRPLHGSDFCRSKLFYEEKCVKMYECYLSMISPGSDNDEANEYEYFSIGFVPSSEEDYYTYSKFYFDSLESCEGGVDFSRYISFSSLTCHGSAFGDRFVMYERCYSDFSSLFFGSSILVYFFITTSPMLLMILILLVFTCICVVNYYLYCCNRLLFSCLFERMKKKKKDDDDLQIDEEKEQENLGEKDERGELTSSSSSSSEFDVNSVNNNTECSISNTSLAEKTTLDNVDCEEKSDYYITSTVDQLGEQKQEENYLAVEKENGSTSSDSNEEEEKSIQKTIRTQQSELTELISSFSKLIQNTTQEKFYTKEEFRGKFNEHLSDYENQQKVSFPPLAFDELASTSEKRVIEKNQIGIIGRFFNNVFCCCCCLLPNQRSHCCEIIKCLTMIFFILMKDGFQLWFASSEFLDDSDIDTSNRDYILLTAVMNMNQYLIWISIGIYIFILNKFILIYCGRFLHDPLQFCIAIGSMKEFVYYRIFKSFFLLWFICINLFCYVVKFAYLTEFEKEKQLSSSNFWFSIIFPELLLIFSLLEVVTYNGVSSYSHLKRLKDLGCMSCMKFPKINIGLAKLGKDPDVILEDFFQVIFLVGDRKDLDEKCGLQMLEKLSKSDEYGHLSWDLISGLKFGEVLYLKDFFFPKSIKKETYLTIFHHHRISWKWIFNIFLFPIICITRT